MYNEIWKVLRNKKDIDLISKEYKISPFMAKIITNRNVLDEKQIKNYIDCDYKNLNDPYDMKDMKKSVDILMDKINEKKKIRIIGDYDVDGVMSVYILYTALKKCEANVDFEIPDRIKDGYGINKNIIELAKNDGVDTIITCDNGISAIEEVDFAKELGITIIITDHHDVKIDKDTKREILPKADGILNPKQSDCNYKFDKICGAGVVFKLMECIYEKYNISKEETYKLIEFVGIATICDVVDLIDENRVFVRKSLEMINNTTNLGLLELIKANELDEKEIVGYHYGFVIGPCINASGRLESAKKGLNMLLSETKEEASCFANELVAINEERKEMTFKGLDRAIEIIESTNLKDDRVLVVYIENIHESLAGIIAGRVKEKYNKPTIIITESEDGIKGSARSIEEYNVFEGLLDCEHFLTRFGGHPMAAGLSLKPENLDLLRRTLNENCNLTDEDLSKKINIDVVAYTNLINFGILDELKKLEPFGKGNEKPIFGMQDVEILGIKILGKNQNFMKIRLLKDGVQMEGTMFDKVSYFENKIINKYGESALNSLYGAQNNRGISISFSFYPRLNSFNGNNTLQLEISNIK
ncbi:MAG: single-stranded-DNA-specific exonuclease RecJ [Peptostreptococcaceae bacterium]